MNNVRNKKGSEISHSNSANGCNVDNAYNYSESCSLLLCSESMNMTKAASHILAKPKLNLTRHCVPFHGIPKPVYYQ